MCESNDISKSEKDGFNRLMFKRLGRILKNIFPSVCSLTSFLFLVLLIISILEQYVAYHVGLISSRYYKVLGEKDLDAFLKTTLFSSLLVAAMALVLTSKSYTANVLYIKWRKLLCCGVHDVYFSGINYYTLNVMKNILDNPDQRMTQDVDRLCKSLSVISITVIISPLKISYYTYKTYLGTGWIGPLGVFTVFAIGTVINKLVMSPIVKFYMKQEKQEGNFRFKHMHVRVNSEAIAFHASGHVELMKTNVALKRLIKSQQTVFNRKFWLDLVQNLYSYMSSIVSYLVIAIPIFDGSYDNVDGADLASIISKNAFLCMTLMYSFSQLVELTSDVVALSGVTHRVAFLMEQLDDFGQEWNKQKIKSSTSFLSMMSQSGSIFPSPEQEDRKSLLSEPDEAGSPAIVHRASDVPVAFILKRVTVTTPNRERTLIKDLSLEICKGRHLLIMGPSSCGKSSLLRVIRGLWSANQGLVAYNFPATPNTVLFLPQKSLLTNGSLYEQIIYPLHLDQTPPTDELLNSLTELADRLLLHGLVNRCGGLMHDPEWHWDDVLSPGEMQRVCFLRLFYHKPQYAFLDESTSALSVDVEEFLYSHCLSLGITLVSVGHRLSLKKFHDTLLTMNQNGSWSLENIVSEADPSSQSLASSSSADLDESAASRL